MFKAARLAKIKEVILDRGQADVSTLSALLNVSEVTIRSDLEQLEQEQFVRRTHGGAILNADLMKQNRELSEFLGVEYDRNKEYIGNIAADMVDDGEWIFIGQGTTCYFVAKALQQKENVNVVTNNLWVAGLLNQCKNAQVLLTGGLLVPDMMFGSGDLFLRSLENIYITKAFLGVSGIDFKSGITVRNAAEVFIMNRLREISNEIVVVADYTKFGRTAFMQVGKLDFAHSIITNENIDETYKSYFFENGVKLFTSYRIKPSAVRSPGEKT